MVLHPRKIHCLEKELELVGVKTSKIWPAGTPKSSQPTVIVFFPENKRPWGEEKLIIWSEGD
jgi:hypothetical protein